MNKLYIFGIGGTGVRVIKSLTFLLASGVKLNNDFEIVPIIIDPHAENENLKQTTSLLKLYEKIRNEVGEGSGFFNTKIRTLKSISQNDTIPDTYNFKLGGSNHQKFKDFLSFDSLSESTKALIKTLFSDEHLDTDMDIGFVGNPHMGSIVLNKFRNSQEFKAFANNFSKDDRVFIISSIFGGTGASGFPMILKNIRRAHEFPELANKELLTNAAIGGLCIQPYFSVDADDTSQIQKSDWMIKTKSAFDYYKKAVTAQGAESVNAMYYLADNISKSYKNDPGQDGQNNPAHMVEMLGALCIIDFLNAGISTLQCENGKPSGPVAKEFGIHSDQAVTDLQSFGENTKRMISKPLTKLFLGLKYFNENIQDSKSQAYMQSTPEFNESFFSSTFLGTDMKQFFGMFEYWLSEMESNERGFRPFNMKSNLTDCINGYQATPKGLFRSKLTFIDYNNFLNDAAVGKTFRSATVKFLKIIHEAGDRTINEYFKSLN